MLGWVLVRILSNVAAVTLRKRRRRRASDEDDYFQGVQDVEDKIVRDFEFLVTELTAPQTRLF